MVKKLFDETIIETNNFKVGQDWEIPIPGFLIIASVRGIKSIADFTKEEAEEFINLVAKTRKGMKEALGIKEVYIFQNEDSGHGFHLWIFPRLGWMEKFGRKIESVRPIMDYAKENMINDKVKKEVSEYAEKMRGYMNGF